MDIAEQIIGGLYLELKERFPELSIDLDEVFEEPAIRLGIRHWGDANDFQNSTHCVVDDGKIKVIIPNSTPAVYGSLVWKNYIPGNLPQTLSRCILYEYSFVEPDADFEPLFEFLNGYYNPDDLC